VYAYYIHAGFYNFLLERVLELLKLAFLLAFILFLGAGINYDTLETTQNLQESLEWQE